MCVWHEGQSGRGGNQMASCLLQVSRGRRKDRFGKSFKNTLRQNLLEILLLGYFSLNALKSLFTLRSPLKYSFSDLCRLQWPTSLGKLSICSFTKRRSLAVNLKVFKSPRFSLNGYVCVLMANDWHGRWRAKQNFGTLIEMLWVNIQVAQPCIPFFNRMKHRMALESYKTLRAMAHRTHYEKNTILTFLALRSDCPATL